MKNYYKILLLILIPLLMFFGCKERTDLTGPQTESGQADFSRFVTIGNSITAGYQSSALYESAQEYSYGNLIAKQVGTQFVQPLVSDPGLSLTGGRLEVASVSPFATTVNTSSGSPINSNYNGLYNNLGIPSAYVYDVLHATNATTCYYSLLPIIGQPIPFFDLVLRGQGTQFQQAKAMHPTFLTLWIGSNDALIYASSGGLIPFTPVQNFTVMLDQIADSIASLGCKVAIGTIPEDMSRAFIETVGGQLLMKGVTAIYGVSSTGDTIAMDLTKNFVLLTALSVLYDAGGNPTGIGFSPQSPLPSQYILDQIEFANLNAAVAGYNNAISNAARANGFALVDFYNFFKKIKESEATGGTVIDGIRFTTTYVTGNLISLDGLHPTSRGQALIANEFIKSINSNFNANVPLVNLANIPGSLVIHGSLGKIVNYPQSVMF